MNVKIYKYQLELTDEQDIEIPYAHRILSVQPAHPDKVQEVEKELWIWVLVQPDNAVRKVRFYIFGTGRPFDPTGLTYCGTCMMPSSLVWHVFSDR